MFPMHTLGVLAALVALLGWGVGDFLIQRSTRRIGVAPSLFSLGVVVAISSSIALAAISG